MQFENVAEDQRDINTPIAVDTLSLCECKTIREKLQGFKSNWLDHTIMFDLQRPPIVMHSLGASTSLHTTGREGDRSVYERLMHDMNPKLKSSFGALYRRLEVRLSEALGAPVQCDERLALPGFHLQLFDEWSFLWDRSHTFRADPEFYPHFDFQPFAHDWSCYDQVDLDKPISITMAIALPSHGGGLETWDSDLTDLSDDYDSTRGDNFKLLEGKERQFIPYSIGLTHVTFGYHLHRQWLPPLITNRPPTFPHDERITLQAHGVKCDGVWRIFF